MSNPADDGGGDRKYKGVRRRKWGKWVSEIRVPGTQDRLWLGSYSSPEAAAFAHDVASYCLKGNTNYPSSSSPSNFPVSALPALRRDMSPKSVQRAASDAGMAVDAQMILRNSQDGGAGGSSGRESRELNVSVEDYL